MAAFSATLIAWYEEHARPLPWRTTRDPYRIWLSEVILQQTRVEQGLAYYERFLEEYPTVQALAQASEEQVLKTWQGLGYYSRARHLHQAARLVTGELGGQFPSTPEGLRALPGVGRYTAAAIASFAFRKPCPVIDGNVYRFAARLFGVATPIGTDAAYSEFEALLLQHIDPLQPHLFNQGLMEMGALVCTPQSPHCHACPFAPRCHAYQHATQALFPVKAPKRAPKERWHYYLHLTHQGHTYLHQRTAPGIWRGLYELPLIESPHPLSPQELKARTLALAGRPLPLALRHSCTHQLTHLTIHASFLHANLPTPLPETPSHDTPFSAQEVKKLPVSRLIDRYLSNEGKNIFPV